MWMTRSRRIATMRDAATYPTFDQVSRQPQPQYVEVPSELVPIFTQLNQNDAAITAALEDMRRKMGDSFASIRDDLRIVVGEINNIRAEIAALSSELHGKAPAAQAPRMEPALPQQGKSETYQSIFRK